MEAGWRALEPVINAGDYRAARDIVMNFPPMRSLERHPAARDRVVALMDQHPWREWATKWPEYDRLEPPAWDRLEELRLPVLVVSGDLEDESFLADGEAVVARVPGARMQVIEGAGHMVNLEAPEAYTAAVVGFLMAVTER
jgi:pimeloyl-ACP methyl ester carboxylesterase